MYPFYVLYLLYLYSMYALYYMYQFNTISDVQFDYERVARELFKLCTLSTRPPCRTLYLVDNERVIAK